MHQRSRLVGFLVTLVVAAAPVLAEEGTDYRQQALQIYRRSVGFKTEIGAGQVPAMAAYLAEQFRAGGFAAADVRILPLADTASLIVRFRGDGSGGAPILSMAHMDVVTARPAEWQRDPYTLIEEGGNFYGRGTYDIKVGVVAITSAFLRLKAEGFVPRRDLILVFTGDEETTQDTAKDLIAHHLDLIQSEYGLNSDSGRGELDEADGRALTYSLATAEKGYASYNLTVHNRGGHSSNPSQHNAIYELAAVIDRVKRYQFPVMWSDTTRQYLRALGANTPGKLGRAMRRFAVNPRDPAAAAVLTGDPDFVGEIRTTCIPTLLQAGHADNALPQTATATINCRTFPGVKLDAVKAALQRLAGPSVAVTELGATNESDAAPLRADVLEAVTKAVRAVRPNVPVVPYMETGTSDGAIFALAGIPSYGLSPIFIKNSEDFRHGLNERIPVRSFYEALDFWYLLLKDLGDR